MCERVVQIICVNVLCRYSRNCQPVKYTVLIIFNRLQLFCFFIFAGVFQCFFHCFYINESRQNISNTSQFNITTNRASRVFMMLIINTEQKLNIVDLLQGYNGINLTDLPAKFFFVSPITTGANVTNH